MMKSLVLVSAVATLSFIEALPAAHADVLPEQVLSSWTSRKQRIETLGSLKITRRVGGNEDTIIVSPHGVISERASGRTGMVKRSVANNDYAFEVQKPKPDDQFFLAGVQRDGEEAGFAKILQEESRAIFYGMEPFGIPFDRLEGTSVLKKVDETRSDGMLRLTCECLANRNFFLRKGGTYTLSLDPAADYLILEESGDHPELKYRLNFEYQDCDLLSRFVSVIRGAFEYPNAAPDVGEDGDLVSCPVVIDVAPEEFRLPFYGIDESVVHAPTRQQGRPVLLAFVFVVLGGIAMAAWHRHQRSRTAL